MRRITAISPIVRADLDSTTRRLKGRETTTTQDDSSFGLFLKVHQKKSCCKK